jgi:hypothetical protein
VYILDTGSTDGTWEIVERYAQRDPGMVRVRRTDELYRTGLRARLLEEHRWRFRRGDWIARVDADEFYHVDPRQFVRERVRPGEGRVAMWQYVFVVTRSEAQAWRERRETKADRARPIEQRRRHYILDPFPEQRLFRYRPTLRWNDLWGNPFAAGPMAVERIPVRHYRFRDLAQMRARERLRRAIAAEARELVGIHWRLGRVRKWIMPDASPKVHYWAPGTDLPVHEDWPDAGAHLLSEPLGRLGSWCHALGLAPVLDVTKYRHTPGPGLLG